MSLKSVILYGLVFLAAFAHSSFAFSFSFSEEEGAEQVAVVGLDQDQKPIVQVIPLASFKSHVRTISASVQDSVLVALTHHNQEATASSGWELQTIGVGVGLSGNIGLGPIWSLNVTPRFRLIFTNSTNPIYPAYN